MIREKWRDLTSFTVILIIFSAFFMVSISAAVASPEQNVCRDLPLGTQAPGSVITVSLDATVDASTSSITIDEVVPSGWTVTGASDGGDYTAQSGHVTWMVTSGATTKTYTYTVQIPDAASGTYDFSGLFRMDGMSSSDTIDCDPSITVEGNSGDSSDSNDLGTATEDDSEIDDESSSVSTESASNTLATINDSEADDESSSASTESVSTTHKSVATTQSPDDSSAEIPAAEEEAGSSMLVIVIGAIVIVSYKLKEN